jgi:N6-adenosine-specific RNA methylase IME4
MTIITKKYQIILADPPWAYNDKTPRGGAENHYPTLSTEDLCKMKVKDIADDNCILFMWATYPKLPDCLGVMASWGFEYKTLGFQWVKLNKKAKTPFWGMGRYTRACTEPCFIGVRGKPKVIDHGIHQLITSPIGRHSEKPAEVRDLILKLIGPLPRIELFARQKVEGWDCFGNEVESNITL